MSKEPISHHYLPQFYLKGFKNVEVSKKNVSRLYSFDKEYVLKVIPKTTKEICCENHRNTIYIDDVNDFFIEKSFSELENIMSEFFKATADFCNLIEKEKRNKLYYWNRNKYFTPSWSNSLSKIMEEPYYSRLFSYFISVFYWRLTVHDNYFSLNTNQKFLSSSIGSLLSKASKNPFHELDSLPDFLHEVKNNVEIPFFLGEEKNVMKVYRNLIFPMAEIYTKYNNNFSIYRYRLVGDVFVGSDSPFITINGSPSLSNDFIFTWSSNVVFINICSTKINMPNSREWAFKVSVLNYLQAKRYAFCSDKKMLENVIRYSNMRYTKSSIDEINSELWRLIN